MIISPYQQDIIRPNYKPFQNNLELIANVLDNKQKTFDSNYAALNNLKQQALDIKFLNKSRQGEIDGFNKRINDHFTKFKDLGDLTNSNVLNGHTAIFEEISGRTDLIRDYKFDQGIQKERDEVLKRAKGKDPLKNGIHPMNMANYARRLNDYANSTGELKSVKGYVNYIDINKLAKDAALDVAEEEITRFYNDGNGNMVEETTKMRDPKKVEAAIQNILTQQGQSQLAEEAEYSYYNNKNNPAYLAQLLDESQKHLVTSKQAIQDQLKTLKDDTSVEALSTRESLENQLKVLDKKIFQSVEEFDDNTLISRSAQVHSSNVLGKLSAAYSYKNVSQELKLDPVWAKVQSLKREDQKIGISRANLKINQAELALKQQEFALEQAGSINTPTSINVPLQSPAEKGEQVLDIIVEKILKTPAAQKDIFELGLSNEDLGIKGTRIKELENFLVNNDRFDMRNNPGIPAKLDAAKKELARLRSQPSGHVANKAEWLNNLIRDNGFYDQYKEPKGSLYIQAAKEAIEVLKLDNQPVNPNAVETKARELLEDPTSGVYDMQQDLLRQQEGFKAVMQLSGADKIEDVKKRRETLKKFLGIHDLISTREMKQTNLDLDKLSPKITKSAQVEIYKKHKNFINANTKWTPGMRDVNGHKPLITQKIGNNEFLHVNEESVDYNGVKEYYFKEDLFKDEDGDLTKKFYVIDTNGETKFIDKDTPVLRLGDFNVEQEVTRNIANMIKPVGSFNDELINDIPVHLSKQMSTGNVTAKFNHPTHGEGKFVFKVDRGELLIMRGNEVVQKVRNLPNLTDTGIRTLLQTKLK